MRDGFSFRVFKLVKLPHFKNDEQREEVGGMGGKKCEMPL